MHAICISSQDVCLLLQGQIFTFAVFLALITANDIINLPWQILVYDTLGTMPSCFPTKKKASTASHQKSDNL